MILAGEVRDGSQVKISAGKGGLTFNGKRPLTADVEEFEPV
jgi:ATP-dependent Clp protease ATP-binding subunit ClpB